MTFPARVGGICVTSVIRSAAASVYCVKKTPAVPFPGKLAPAFGQSSDRCCFFIRQKLAQKTISPLLASPDEALASPEEAGAPPETVMITFS